ncbi:MAG: hypothetical protein F6K30_15690 [Cyanothece sp. SIO2G6]|nr:hypothetical protein [Cyanothece sp. SIO2G6]
MTSSSSFTAAERIMSLKAATVGGLCTGIVSLSIALLHRWLVVGTLSPLSGSLMSMANLTLVVNGAIAALSGALFALTYRYAVRQDNNVQLKSGVVLAFTLVRGLALVDAGSAILLPEWRCAIAQHFWPFAAACGESFVMFGLTAIVLNIAFQRQWLTPFGQSASLSRDSHR